METHFEKESNDLCMREWKDFRSSMTLQLLVLSLFSLSLSLSLRSYDHDTLWSNEMSYESMFVNQVQIKREKRKNESSVE